MARARLIKPGFFTNDELAEVPLEGRLLFAGIWTIADREGRLEDRPKRIKAEVMPFDNIDTEALLADLESRGFITRYTVAGQRLIQVTSFLKHQSPHPREVPSKLPPPPCMPAEPMAEHHLGQALNGTSPAVPIAVAVAVAGSSGPSEAVAVDADHGDAAAAAENDLRYRRISDSWMKATGSTLPPAPMERFEAYADRSSEEWVLAAIEKTGGAGIKRPAYAYSILDAWLQDGRDDEPQSDPTNPFKESRLTKQIAAAKERMG